MRPQFEVFDKLLSVVEGPRSLVQVYSGTLTYIYWLPCLSNLVVPTTGAIGSKWIILL